MSHINIVSLVSKDDSLDAATDAWSRDFKYLDYVYYVTFINEKREEKGAAPIRMLTEDGYNLIRTMCNLQHNNMFTATVASQRKMEQAAHEYSAMIEREKEQKRNDRKKS